MAKDFVFQLDAAGISRGGGTGTEMEDALIAPSEDCLERGADLALLLCADGTTATSAASGKKTGTPRKIGNSAPQFAQQRPNGVAASPCRQAGQASRGVSSEFMRRGRQIFVL